MKFYVYRHIRLDSNTPFYVGKGRGNRAFSKSGRNKYWKSIVNKNDYKIEIIKYFNNEETAFLFEEHLIKLYKIFSNCEANIAIGGRGGKAGIPSWNKGTKGTSYYTNKSKEEIKSIKEKKSKSMKGKNKGKNPFINKTPEEIKKIYSNRTNVGIRNSNFKGYYHTPFGTFHSVQHFVDTTNLSSNLVRSACKKRTKMYKTPEFDEWWFEKV